MLKNLFFWIALCWTGVILFFCLTSSNDIPTITIPNIDKLVHAFFHFVFTILWFLYLKNRIKKRNRIQLLLGLVFFSFLFGLGIEILQEKMTLTRSGDYLDVLANTTGAIFAFVVVYFANKRKKKSINE